MYLLSVNKGGIKGNEMKMSVQKFQGSVNDTRFSPSVEL